MKFRITIDVADKNEGELVERALSDPVMLATVKIVGALLPLTERARKRVMQHVIDKMDEDRQSNQKEGA